MSAVLLGLALGGAMALSTRMRDSLVVGLGRRGVALGVAGGLGVALVQAGWVALAVSVAGSAGPSLGSLARPLGALGAAVLLAVAADVGLRAAILGPTAGNAKALSARPAATFLRMAVIAAIDPRAMTLVLGMLLAVASLPDASNVASVLAGSTAVLAGWWTMLVALGVAGVNEDGRVRRAANLVGALILVLLAARTLLGGPLV